MNYKKNNIYVRKCFNKNLKASLFKEKEKACFGGIYDFAPVLFPISNGISSISTLALYNFLKNAVHS